MRVPRFLAGTLTLLVLAHGCGASRGARWPVLDLSGQTLRLFDERLTPREPGHRPYAALPHAACARPALDMLHARAVTNSRWHDRVSSALLVMMRQAGPGEQRWLRRALELVVWHRCAVDLERAHLGLPPLAEAWSSGRIAEARKGGMPVTLGPADLEDLEELRRVFAFAGGNGP